MKFGNASHFLSSSASSISFCAKIACSSRSRLLVGPAFGRSDRLHVWCDTDHHFDLQFASRSTPESAGPITVLSQEKSARARGNVGSQSSSELTPRALAASPDIHQNSW